MATAKNSVIEHRAYARVGLLGNPSDVYYGRTISISLGNFWASVKLEPSDNLMILPHPAHDLVQFDSLPHLVRFHSIISVFDVLVCLVNLGFDLILCVGVCLFVFGSVGVSWNHTILLKSAAFGLNLVYGLRLIELHWGLMLIVLKFFVLGLVLLLMQIWICEIKFLLEID